MWPEGRWLRPELLAEKEGKAKVLEEGRGGEEEGGGDGRAAGASSDLKLSMLASLSLKDTSDEFPTEEAGGLGGRAEHFGEGRSLNDDVYLEHVE